MKTPRIELIYFEGCPHVAEARRVIAEAIAATGRSLAWSELDLRSNETPAGYTRFGSPTILIDGVEIGAPDGGAVGLACRTSGAPELSAVIARLAIRDTALTTAEKGSRR